MKVQALLRVLPRTFIDWDSGNVHQLKPLINSIDGNPGDIGLEADSMVTAKLAILQLWLSDRAYEWQRGCR